MYIEDRLFSENNPEEVLYSVTMTESEYALYSEFQKEFAARELIKAIKPVSGSGFNKAYAKAISKTRQQLENVSIGAIGNPARQEKIRKSLNHRANAIAGAANEGGYRTLGLIKR